MQELDFTTCPRVHNRAYNGANGKKIAVEFAGGVWLLKFSPSAAERPNELSYSNSCLSEYLGSTIFALLGIEAQEVKLGTHCNGRRKIVCACKDFTIPGKRFYDFCSIKNTVIDSETCGHGTELEDVLDVIERQQFIDPLLVRERFWEMFVIDALIGNFDRHNGNWGFLVDEQTGRSELAPVFDCGSSLLPQADERIMRLVLTSEEELDARIYTFPNSMLKTNGHKINYADFLAASKNPGLKMAMTRLLPRISALDIGKLISETPFLTPLQREFYEVYLIARRERLFK